MNACSRGILTLVLVASTGCRTDPLEKPLALLDEGGCAAALPALQGLTASVEPSGRAARAIVARCRFEEALSAPDTSEQTWLEVIGAMRRSLRESDEEGLPMEVAPVDPSSLGTAVEHAAGLALERGAPADALSVVHGNEDVARYADTILPLHAEAHLMRAQWGEAAVVLERAGDSRTLTDAQRARSLMLAAGAWRNANQREKALACFSRAERVRPAGFSYPGRLIEEGEEMQHVLGELIAASVHGILVACFERDWDGLQAKPQEMNFFVEKREKDFLEASDVISSLEEALASQEDEQLARAAPELLYQILNMRALVHASGGDFASAREDLSRARSLMEDGPEAPRNIEILSLWKY